MDFEIIHDFMITNLSEERQKRFFVQKSKYWRLLGREAEDPPGHQHLRPVRAHRDLSAQYGRGDGGGKRRAGSAGKRDRPVNFRMETEA
jgi:hypothetical protein